MTEVRYQNSPAVRATDGWQTPSDIIERARVCMGSIDTDPATSKEANVRIKAKRIYTVEKSGVTLSASWHGNVWVNPPFSMNKHFVSKAITEWEHGYSDQTIYLCNANTDTKWFQRLLNAATSVCFTAGRIRFIDPETGKAADNNTKGQAIFYFGSNKEKFEENFKDVGKIIPLR